MPVPEQSESEIEREDKRKERPLREAKKPIGPEVIESIPEGRKVVGNGLSFRLQPMSDERPRGEKAARDKGQKKRKVLPRVARAAKGHVDQHKNPKNDSKRSGHRGPVSTIFESMSVTRATENANSSIPIETKKL